MAGCPHQDLLDGFGGESGVPLYKRVREYAADNGLWINDFVDVWAKMGTNGYSSDQLMDGPKNFWIHI